MALDENALIDFAKMQAYVPTLLAGEQAHVEDLINVASAAINGYCKRKLKARDHIVTLDGTGRNELLLPEYPIVSVAHLYIDPNWLFGPSTEVDSTIYTIYKERGVLWSWSGFPLYPQCVKSEFRAGFEEGAVPQDLQIAAVETVAWYLDRFRGEGRVGVRQIQNPDGIATTFEPDIPLSAKFRLDPYVRPEVS